MAIFTWNKRFNINNEMLDEHHQQLFQLTKRLQIACREKRHKDVETQIFGELIAYANFHFAAEEELFTLHLYPEYQEHTEQHDHFIKQVIEMRDAWLSGHLRLESIHDFLRDWLINHILIEDKKFGQYLAGNAKKSAA